MRGGTVVSLGVQTDMAKLPCPAQTPVQGFKVLNKGRHVGLLQLAALAATGTTFLGPNKSYKFVQDEESGESVLTCSAFRLLEHLDLACAVGQLLNETVLAHQKVFRTGTTGLLFMTGVWSTAVLECLHRGVPVPDIVSEMSAALESCSEVCKVRCVAIEDVSAVHDLQKQIHSFNITSQVSLPCNPKAGISQTALLRNAHESASASSHHVRALPAAKSAGIESTGGVKATQSKQRKIKLTHSRHLNSKEDNSMQKSKLESLPKVSCSMSSGSGFVNITHLGDVLSHGCVYGMNLAIDANRLQTEKEMRKNCSPTAFDVCKIVTFVLPGLPEEQSCVIPGFLALVSIEQASLVRHFKDRELQVVLINGDLNEKYRHLGFNNPTHCRNVIENLDLLGRNLEDEWLNDALTALLKVKVNIVFVEGVASTNLTQTCVKHNILIIQRVKNNILKDFAETTGALPVTYVTHVNERCVGRGVCVSMWRETKAGKMMSVNITARQSSLVTAVITSSVDGKLQALEDQFWTCGYRLYHALHEGKLFPGAGAVEMLCLGHLEELVKKDMHVAADCLSQVPDGQYRGTILQHMADGWKEYVATVMCNTGVWSSKLEAYIVINQSLSHNRKGASSTSDFPELLLYSDTSSNGTSGERIENVNAYDNVTVKLEAWRRALDLVLTVLQTDTEIITGYGPEETEEVMWL
ncbi:chaperonin-containing T-complex member BBS12 [Amia ocellicauda]|uniref:chaperonin-containing T-complex member BBS12 n=1 Tax=Amia ocellicauda TaxID=2972642 RepID=UPI003463A310